MAIHIPAYKSRTCWSWLFRNQMNHKLVVAQHLYKCEFLLYEGIARAPFVHLCAFVKHQSKGSSFSTLLCPCRSDGAIKVLTSGSQDILLISLLYKSFNCMTNTMHIKNLRNFNLVPLCSYSNTRGKRQGQALSYEGSYLKVPMCIQRIPPHPE